MTKEFTMPNDKDSVRPAVSDSSFGLRHFLVISASSLVIRALTLAIRAYQLTISPMQAFLCGPTGGCRFTPSCSQYAMDAIRSHGALAGSWLAVKRICHCHPWGGCGHDPAPEPEVRSQKSGVGI